MKKRYLEVATTVVAVAVAASVLYGLVLGVTRGGGPLQWLAVIDGFLIAAAVLAVWNVAVTRDAAAVGLGAVIAIALVGSAGVTMALSFVMEPVGWAVALTLLVRFAVPTAAGADEARRELVEH
jgi:hypothetical protein